MAGQSRFGRQGRMGRRQFVRVSAAAAAGIAGGLAAGPLARALAAPQPPDLPLEPNPEVHVMRWIGFVRRDEEVWLANTRRWEELTGGRVVMDTYPWEEVRARAAMEAALGAGHDMVLGWFDDPHMYPDAVLDLGPEAQYLGARYGGWYPVCEVYGCQPGTDRWLCLPICAPTQAMNFRKSWLCEAGYDTVPQDVAGFLECCKALHAKGHPTGFALGHAVGDATCWTHWWLWAFGGKTMQPDGATVAIDSPETRQALEAARELHATMHPDVGQWQDAHNNQAFLAGEIGLTSNGVSILAAAQQQNPRLAADIGTAPIPVGPVGRPTDFHLFSVAFVFRHARAPNAARHYLRFMFEQEQYGPWVSETMGYNCQTLRHYRSLPAWDQDPRLTPFAEGLDRMLWNGFAGPPGPASAAAMSEFVVVDMFADVCLHGLSPKAAAERAANRLRTLQG